MSERVLCYRCGHEVEVTAAGTCPSCGLADALSAAPAAQAPGPTAYNAGTAAPQPQYAPPPPQPYAAPQAYAPKPQSSGKAVASLVLGILGMFAWCLPILGLPVGMTGLILGLQSIKSEKRGFAIAGVVLASICLLLTLLNGIGGAVVGFMNALNG